jgi:hypothetical protein
MMLAQLTYAVAHHYRMTLAQLTYAVAHHYQRRGSTNNIVQAILSTLIWLYFAWF